MVTTCKVCYKKFPNIIYQTDDDIGMYSDYFYECLEHEYICPECSEKEDNANDWITDIVQPENLTDYDYNE